jgi:hypothetical protein
VKLKLYEWKSLRRRGYHASASDPSNYPTYAAISHVWDMSEEVKRIAGEAGRPLHVEIPEGLHTISWHGLQEAANAAHQLQCEYIWLDLICLDQIPRDDPVESWRGDDGEKEEQIGNMANIYKFAKAVIIMVGGVSAVQGVDTPSAWMDRAWTLQESAICLRDTYVYVQWPYANRFTVNPEAKIPYEVDFIPVEGEHQKALIELLDLLEMPDLSKYRTSPDLGLPSNFQVRCLDGHKDGSQCRTAKTALLAVLKATNDRMRQAGVWRSILLRTSTHPVDVVYSVIGLLGVEVDEYRKQRTVQFLFNDLATKAAVMRNPGWLAIGGVDGSSIPRDLDSHLIPCVPIYEGQNLPFYDSSDGRCQSHELVSDSETYIRTYSIRFKNSSLPHIICAHMLHITSSTTPQQTENRNQYSNSLEFNSESGKLKGKCTYRGNQSDTAVLVGTVGSWSFPPSPHKDDHYMIFISWERSKWIVCGDGRLTLRGNEELPQRQHFLVGKDAPPTLMSWHCDCKSEETQTLKLPLSYGVSQLPDIAPPDKMQRKPIHWYGIKVHHPTLNF